jgi:hypothetical protein
VDVVAEGGFGLMLVNARHVKMEPGQKTDVADGVAGRAAGARPVPPAELAAVLAENIRLTQASAAKHDRKWHRFTLRRGGLPLGRAACGR